MHVERAKKKRQLNMQYLSLYIGTLARATSDHSRHRVRDMETKQTRKRQIKSNQT